jgi:arsenite methyltransferase
MATPLQLDVDLLHRAIQEEYAKVATRPTEGFHFHTGRVLVDRLGYPAALIDALPESALESFAGVGNPFSWGELQRGETVVDLGSRRPWSVPAGA